MSRDEQIKKLATEMASAAECAVDDAHLINEYPLLPYATSLVEKNEEIVRLKRQHEWAWQFVCPIHGHMTYMSVRTDKTCGVEVQESKDHCKELLIRGDEFSDQIARLKEKLGIAEAKGAALVEQIDKGDFYDPESHSATMLQALHEFRAALAAIREKGTE